MTPLKVKLIPEAERFMKDLSVELFFDEGERPCARYRHPTRGGWETVAVGSEALAALVRNHLVIKKGKAPKKPEVEAVTASLAAFMQYGPSPGRRNTSLRVAAEGDSLFIDLADDARRVVTVTANGWNVGQDCPVAFVRRPGMEPLPEPQRGGSFADLLGVLPQSLGDAQKHALVGWLLAAAHPGFPKPILYLRGPMGSGKSVLARRLRALLDPSAAPLGGTRASARDQSIAACNSWVQGFDNLSRLSLDQSDALCRTTTGDSHRAKKNYADMDEVFQQFRRPIILTSISDVVTKADLLDRCIPIELDRISGGDRRLEAELDEQFERDRPRLLGIVMDAIAAGLRTPPDRSLAGASRMCDAVVWAERCFQGLGLPPRKFADAVRDAQAGSITDPLKAWAPWPFLRKLLTERKTITTTARQLLLELNTAAEASVAPLDFGWPKNESMLGGKLRELTSALEAAGVRMVNSKSGDVRRITLQLVADSDLAV